MREVIFLKNYENIIKKRKENYKPISFMNMDVHACVLSLVWLFVTP